MKEVSKAQSLLAIQVYNELDIPVYSIEKDFIVTEVLDVISKIKSDDYQIIFCGGTCLSKAHKMIERFSEDVDLKIIPKAERNRSQEKKLFSKLKDELLERLSSAGFEISDLSNTASSRHFSMNLPYHREVNASTGSIVRPEIKLEMTVASLYLEPVNRGISSLVSDFIKDPGQQAFTMSCIDPVETLVEKLVSFPRRVAKSANADMEIDKNLVRHIFDVHCIMNSNFKPTHKVMSDIFSKVVQSDAKKYAGHDPVFDANPFEAMRSAIINARENPALAEGYEKFTSEFVYKTEIPSYEESFSTFIRTFESVMPKTLNLNMLKSNGIEKSNSSIDEILSPKPEANVTPEPGK